jgi:hypothetical protein
VGSGSSGDTDIQYIKPSELFPKKLAWVEGGSANTIPPPFPLLPGEDIIYEVMFTISQMVKNTNSNHITVHVGPSCGRNIIHFQLQTVSI